MTNKSTWKKRERGIAHDFDTERNPLSGSMSGHSSSDSLSETFYIESKLRAKPGGWNLFQQTKEKAKTERKIPVVVLSKKYHRDKIVMLDYNFLLKLLKKSGYLKDKLEEVQND